MNKRKPAARSSARSKTTKKSSMKRRPKRSMWARFFSAIFGIEMKKKSLNIKIAKRKTVKAKKSTSTSRKPVAMRKTTTAKKSKPVRKITKSRSKTTSRRRMAA